MHLAQTDSALTRGEFNELLKVVLALKHNSKWGSIGLSRRRELYYKDLVYDSLAELCASKLAAHEWVHVTGKTPRSGKGTASSTAARCDAIGSSARAASIAAGARVRASLHAHIIARNFLARMAMLSVPSPGFHFLPGSRCDPQFDDPDCMAGDGDSAT